MTGNSAEQGRKIMDNETESAKVYAELRKERDKTSNLKIVIWFLVICLAVAVHAHYF
jgi:uncharacterized membrane protein